MIDELRARGVVHFSGLGFTVEFFRQRGEPEVAPHEPPQPEERVEVKGKLGKDGLTAEEQEAVYMRVLDAE